MDLLDILYGSAMRDAESHDPSFSSFYWYVSSPIVVLVLVVSRGEVVD